jgi:DNA-directed RNA polymerase specialized sigma24 family protein
MAHAATREAIEAAFRLECPRLIGALVGLVRDVGLAEDLAQQALVAALERWPVAGLPDNPGAWLMVTARNRAVDQLRRRQLVERTHGVLADEANGRCSSRGRRPATGQPQPRSTRASVNSAWLVTMLTTRRRALESPRHGLKRHSRLVRDRRHGASDLRAQRDAGRLLRPP